MADVELTNPKTRRTHVPLSASLPLRPVDVHSTWLPAQRHTTPSTLPAPASSSRGGVHIPVAREDVVEIPAVGRVHVRVPVVGLAPVDVDCHVGVVPQLELVVGAVAR